MDATKTFVTLTCDKCKCQFEITLDKKHRRERAGSPNYCKNCMKEHLTNIKKNYFNNLSEEEKKKFKERRNWLAKATPEEKAAYSEKMKKIQESRTPEERAAINKKNSEGLKKHWERVSEDDRIARTRPMIEASKLEKASLTKEELSKRARSWFDQLSPEEQERVRQEGREKMIAYNASISDEEKLRRVALMNAANKAKPQEEKDDIYTRSHEWYHNLSDMEKAEYAKKRVDWYNALSDEEKEEHARKSNIIKNVYNGLNNRFQQFLDKGNMPSYYEYRREVITHWISYHTWDYGIYCENKLIMVIDLDGRYFHADICDYDGIHSDEHLDVQRSLSVNPDLSVKVFIIQEEKFDLGCELAMKYLPAAYHVYIDMMCDEFSRIPFPMPHYSDKDLMQSYMSLMNESVYTLDMMKLDRTIGKRIIEHFHPSIYMDKVNNSISVESMWRDISLLKESITNHQIIQSYLNPNKILQNFVLPGKVMRPAVFSPSKLRSIILSTTSSTIFDPCVYYGETVIASASIPRDFIGISTDIVHYNENRNMMNWAQNINKQSFKSSRIMLMHTSESANPSMIMNADLIQVLINIEFPDDQITNIMERYKCRSYTFIVRNTVHNMEVYKSSILMAIEEKNALLYGSYLVIRM